MHLEEDFLKISDLSFFPGKNSYVSKYNEIATTFNDSIHPEIKTKMLEYEQEGYYNDHGVEHIKMVINRESRIIDNISSLEPNFELSNYEKFILLVATHLHDAGHLIDSRKKHTQKTNEILSRFFSKHLDTPEIKVIGAIARAHGGKNDPIGSLKEGGLLGINIRSKLLAALLRLGDELADDSTRASKALLALEDEKKDKENKHINQYSEIYHRYSQSLHSVELEGNEIKLSFCINEEQLMRKFYKKDDDGNITEHYLLDEIYARTEKTFLEALYCNRFFPANSRFNVIKVDVELLEEYAISFQTISYEIKEMGYPLVNESLIDVKDYKGIKIDGAYIANTIKSKQNEESI